MKHRHLNSADSFSSAAIDDIISRGGLADWAELKAAVLLVWVAGMALAPHQLTDSAYLVIVFAYVVFYAKVARSARGADPTGTDELVARSALTGGSAGRSALTGESAGRSGELVGLAPRASRNHKSPQLYRQDLQD